MWERGLKSDAASPTVDPKESLPMWERGLKCINGKRLKIFLIVAPHVGAWIEIEISMTFGVQTSASLPMWERGLKFKFAFNGFRALICRSPCGSVD